MTSPHKQQVPLLSQTAKEPTWTPESPTRSISTDHTGATIEDSYSALPTVAQTRSIGKEALPLDKQQPTASNSGGDYSITAAAATTACSRTSRVKFRHAAKLARRRDLRRQEATERQARAQQRQQQMEAEIEANPALKVIKKIEKEHAEAEYERQKKQWEMREIEIEQANKARREAEQARQQQEATAAMEWNQTLARMITQRMASSIPKPMIIPSGQGTVNVFEPGRVNLPTNVSSTAVAVATALETMSNEAMAIESSTALCPWYTKTAACRLGFQCNLRHPPPPPSSKRLLLRGLFAPQRRILPADLDDALEHDDDEEEERYLNFYTDIMSELVKYGTIKHFKVCRNEVDHLRGNVYIEYNEEEDAARAVRQLRGRWYAGKRLFPELIHLTSWQEAICGSYERTGGCAKGESQCQLLHFYRNPNTNKNTRNKSLNEYLTASTAITSTSTSTLPTASTSRSYHSTTDALPSRSTKRTRSSTSRRTSDRHSSRSPSRHRHRSHRYRD